MYSCVIQVKVAADPSIAIIKAHVRDTTYIYLTPYATYECVVHEGPRKGY